MADDVVAVLNTNFVMFWVQNPHLAKEKHSEIRFGKKKDMFVNLPTRFGKVFFGGCCIRVWNQAEKIS